MLEEQRYTSRRYSIVTALCDKIKEIDNSEFGRTKLWGKVFPKLAFWDEIDDYPAVYLGLGPEERAYQGGGYKDRFLTISVRCYVKQEDPQRALELLLEDLETVIEQNGRLAYQDSSGTTQYTQDILIVSIDTDEGALDPHGAGEMILTVRY